MARLFDDISDDQYLEGTFQEIVTPVTLAIWGRPDSLDYHIALSVADSATTANWNLHLRDTGDIWAAASDTSSISYATATIPYTVGKWHHFCGVYPTDSLRNIYVWGQASASNTTTRVVSSVDRWRIGLDADSGPFHSFGGALADAVVWKSVLSQSEAWALGKGASPLLIQPHNIVAYVPLHSPQVGDRDVVRGVTLVPNGTTKPTWDANPPEIQKRNLDKELAVYRQIVKAPSVAAVVQFLYLKRMRSQ